MCFHFDLDYLNNLNFNEKYTNHSINIPYKMMTSSELRGSLSAISTLAEHYLFSSSKQQTVIHIAEFKIFSASQDFKDHIHTTF